jgi:hypothetical protein
MRMRLQVHRKEAHCDVHFDELSFATKDMKMLDFSLILPVLTSQDISAGELGEFIQGHSEPDCESPTPEYVPAILAEIDSIPDGIHLVSFPGHYNGADCWCRPIVVAVESAVSINHKNLGRGEFDS